MKKPVRDVLLALRRYRWPLYRGFMGYAKRARWRVLVTPNWLPRGWYGDGVAADFFEWDELDALAAPRKTAIVTRGNAGGRRVRQVHTNPLSAARLALSHLRSRGYSRFGVLTQGESPTDPTGDFARLARAKGCEVSCCRLSHHAVGRDFARTVETARRFIRDIPKPCALLAVYLGGINIIYRACEREGLSIPRDVAVLSMTDEPDLCGSMTPTVTALAAGLRKIGVTMARVLDRLMKGRAVPAKPVVVAPEGIEERESTNMLAVHDPRAAEAVRYVLENYAGPVSVEDLARRARVSTPSLRRLMRTHLGMSPRDFISSVRMDRIKALLRDTDDTLEIIASKTGYGSAMALSLAFKREEGGPPGAYRQRCRE